MNAGRKRGVGEDILAGNCMPIVGLYRDIYGIQPRHNRLYLEPHLTAELNGTQLRYNLRGQSWLIDLNTSGSRLAVEDFTVCAPTPFALNVKGNTAEFFPGNRSNPALSVTRSLSAPVQIQVEAWSAGPAAARSWIESSAKHGTTVRHVISELRPLAEYKLARDGESFGSLRADASGTIEFKTTLLYSKPQRFELVLE